MEPRETVVGGLPTRWYEYGAGSPVVMVHGIPTSPLLWRHVVPLVEGRTFAWEMTGYGTSIPEGSGVDLGLAAQARRLLAWIDELGLERPVLVGHDLGGGVAQIAVVTSPERFSGIVLTNAVCYDSWPIPSIRAMAAAAPVLAHLPDVAIYPAIVQLLRRGHDDRHVAGESIGVHWQPYVTHGAAPSLMAQVAALRTQDTLQVADGLPRLGLPARMVWGAADQFQKVRFGERLAQDLGTVLRRIPDGRHFTPEDHPGVVAEAINEVLATG
jgi:pimeloyl-ACP methyl ester carboxylesterase